MNLFVYYFICHPTCVINRNSCEVIAYTFQTSSQHISFSTLLFCYFSSYYRYCRLTCCCCYCYLRFKIPIVIRLDHHIQTMAHMVFFLFSENCCRDDFVRCIDIRQQATKPISLNSSSMLWFLLYFSLTICRECDLEIIFPIRNGTNIAFPYWEYESTWFVLKW